MTASISERRLPCTGICAVSFMVENLTSTEMAVKASPSKVMVALVTLAMVFVSPR